MNGKFTVHQTNLKDVKLIQPRVHTDSRGFFLESYNETDFKKIGITTYYVQDNHSFSKKGVIRGLHFQRIHPQEKLVRVISGSIYDVVIDIRNDSPQFGRFIGEYLSGDNMTMIHIPPGFAHGFLALENSTHVVYKTSELYYQEYDTGIRWNDPILNIPWPLREFGIASPIISDKDSKLPGISDIGFLNELG